MRTARLEIDLPSARHSPLAAAAPPRSGHPGPREEKSRGEIGGKIEEVISRPCFCDKGCAGKPGSTVKTLPGRPGRPGCGLPGAPKLPQAPAPKVRSSCRKQPHRMRGRYGRTTFGPGAGRVSLGRKSGAGMAVRFTVGSNGSHNQKPSPGQPRPPSHCFPARYSPLWTAHFCPLLPGIARNCSGGGGGGDPEQVSAHRQPFSVGFTTSAVRRSSRRPPGCFRCGQRTMNPC